MQSIIAYVYEYEGERRIRNAGFLKMQMQGSSCLVNLHIKSPLIRPVSSWTLYTFHSDGSTCTLYPVQEIPGGQHAFSTQITLNPDLLPVDRFTDSMEGFWISDGGSRIFAAAWKPTFVDSGKFTVWEARDEMKNAVPAKEPADNISQVAEQETEDLSDTGTQIPEPTADLPAKAPEQFGGQIMAAQASPEKQDNTQNTSVQTADLQPDLPETDQDDQIGETFSAGAEQAEAPPAEEPEETNRTASSACPEQQSAFRCRKIRRQDMTMLPRKYWFLANNSFLLHGYHNYSHLILVEDGTNCYLGVPGIYHPKEAHAAELFGFPRFTSEFVPLLKLEEDECGPNGQFGHWMRRIRL